MGAGGRPCLLLRAAGCGVALLAGCGKSTPAPAPAPTTERLEKGSPLQDTGPAADQACANLATAACGRLQTCAPFLLETLYGDVKACVDRILLPCKPVFSAAGSQTTPAQLEACARAVEGESCGEALNNPRLAVCDRTGMLGEGSGCATGNQCESGYCRTPAGRSCGRCVKRVATGYGCLVDPDCAAGLLCDQGTCVSPGGLNSPCGSGLPTCGRELACVHGKCSRPIALGGRCTAATECDAARGLFCNPSTGKCASTQVARAGAPCGVLGDALVACGGGGTCSRGRCVAAANDGASCDVQDGPTCFFGAQCVNGSCVVPDPVSCR